MRSTLAPASILAATLVFSAVACQKNSAHDPEAQVPETTTGASATARRPLMCEDPLEIVLPTPKDGGPTATFEVDPGDQIEPGLGCQSIRFDGRDEDATFSQGNETFTIAAHDTDLQRIKVGHTTVLIHIPPGTHVKIGSHPCFSWQFLSPDLSVEGARAPEASCISEEEEATCPEGMTKTRTRLAVDPLCENPEEPQMRCVKPTLVSLLPPSAWTKPVTYAEVGAVDDHEPSLPGPIDPPLEVLPASCGFLRVDTGAERVFLAVGFGQEWKLRVDPGGKLSGTVSK